MKGKSTFTEKEISELEKLIMLRNNSSSENQKSIRNQMRKIGFYGRDDFGIQDLKISDLKNLINSGRVKVSNLQSIAFEKPKELIISNQKLNPETLGKNKDENYVLDLCDQILGYNSSRQHKFDFLLGDSNRKLPVDAFYCDLNLVIEYRERQHTEEVSFFDKTNKLTVSGVHRGEQRKIYDQRRREVLPQNNLDLIEISYSDFKFDRKKRIIRNPKEDQLALRKILFKYLKVNG